MDDIKELKVRNYYDSFSDNYDNFYHKIQFQKFGYLNDILTKFNHNDLIDLGGGTGLLSSFLQIKLLTLDLSYNMLKEGKLSSYISQGIVGDINNIPIRNKAFTHIVSFTAVQNTSNYKQSFKEIRRISKKQSENVVSVLKKLIDKTMLINISDKYFSDYQFIEFPIEDIGIYNNSIST